MKIYEKSKITINARPKMNERRFHFSMSEEAREGRPKSQPTICVQNQAFSPGCVDHALRELDGRWPSFEGPILKR